MNSNFGSNPQQLLDLLHARLMRPRDVDLFINDDNVLSEFEFASRVASWLRMWQTLPKGSWALYEPRVDEFAAAFLAASIAQQTLYISNDTLPSTVQHLSQWVDGFVGAFEKQSVHNPLTKGHSFSDLESKRFIPNPEFDQAFDENLLSLNLEDCPRLLSDYCVFFLTSGSTGTPSIVQKSFKQLCLETMVLELFFGQELLKNIETPFCVHATVSHQHFFGFIFRFWWPLLFDRRMSSTIIRYPEQLLAKTLWAEETSMVLISSPAFLSRVSESQDWSDISNRITHVFSAGGPLCVSDNQRIREQWNSTVIEIYGSTETGAVACKLNNALSFQPLPQVKVRLSSNGQMQLQTPYLEVPDAWFEVADQAQIENDGHFKLLGRSDRIIKLEEKRISLTQMERILHSRAWFRELYVVPFAQQNRTLLGVVAVMSEEGIQAFHTHQRVGLINLLKQELRGTFESLAIPRRWRFVTEVARNEQDKVSHQTLLSILESKPVVEHAQIQTEEQTTNTVLLKLHIPKELIYFEGHFPSEPILPGVTQIDWAVRYTQKYFGKHLIFEGLKQLKFSQVIRPEFDVQLHLQHDEYKQQTVFQYTSEQGVHASGIIVWKGVDV